MKRSEIQLRMKQVLLRQRDALRRELEAEMALLGSNRDDPSGDDAYSFEVEMESHELRAVENALDRIRDGSYGTCDECGENIALARLQALPIATLCINCQRKTEDGRNPRFDARDRSRSVARVRRRSKPAPA